MKTLRQRLDNAIPNASTCRSLELGVIRCIDEIMEQVRRNTGLSVTDMQVVLLPRLLFLQRGNIPHFLPYRLADNLFQTLPLL